METPVPLCGVIVAMNRDHVIGVNGGLPWHYPADLKHFKQRTMGCALLMGRKTWESIGATPLPGRRNIVISRKGVPHVECYRQIQDALAACAQRDLWIIGGGQIYSAALPHANLMDVTWVPDPVDSAEPVTFPRIDPHQWRIVKEVPLSDNPTLLNTIYLRRDLGRN